MTNTNIIRQIKEKYTSAEVFPNPDTVFQEYMLNQNYLKDGIADKIMDIYSWSHDRKAVVEMFNIITGKNFNDFLRTFIEDKVKIGENENG